MDMSGQQLIPADRETVWRGLNDPEVLRQSIPGCESIEKQSDTEMTAKVTAKVGPVKARFTGAVTLSNLNPPESYTISGEGKGGAAGFAKGGAEVKLEDADGGTMLSYEVHANVGGKLAQLGGRLIDGTAKRMAGEFFDNFAKVVGETAAPDEAVVEAPEEAPAEAPPETPAAEPEAQPVGEPMPAMAEEAPPAAAETSEPAETPAPQPEPGTPPAEPTMPEPSQTSPGLSPVIWVGGLVVIVIAIIYLLT
ncbi:MAG: carbon monoxide dehydrogenase subunit G [Pseudomonadota bacterium]